MAEAPIDVEAVAHRLRSLASAKRLSVLRFLRSPRYLEEIASELGISRQAAQEHMQQLLDVGLVEKQAGVRDSGNVVDYRLVRANLYSLVEDLRDLAAELPEIDPGDVHFRTRAGSTSAIGARGDLPEVVVVQGLEAGLAARLHRGSATPPLLIGRDPASGLVVDWDLLVSNRHAEVRATAEGFQLVDLYSRNGTFLNGTRLPPAMPAPLRTGDILHVGRTALVFRD